IRAAPGEAERTQASLDERLEPRQLRIDGLCALEVEDRRERAACERALDIRDVPCHDQRSRSVQREQDLDHLGRDARRTSGVERLALVYGVDLAVVAPRDEDGEETGDEPALAGAHEVEVRRRAAFAQIAPAHPRLEQRIVVTVDDRNHSRSGGRSEYIAKSTRLPIRSFHWADRSTPSRRKPARSATRHDATFSGSARSWSRPAPGCASAHRDKRTTAAVVTPRPRASVLVQYPISPMSRLSFQWTPMPPRSRSETASTTANACAL